MSDEPGSFGSFVPIEERSLAGLERAAEEARRAGRELREAAAALAELSEDLKIDAVRRLRERGASEAQVERYERAYRQGADRVRRAAGRLDEACGKMAETAERLRG